MLLQIAYYNDPILRKKTKPIATIDNQLRTLVDNMIETMRHNDGMGLAAPQVFQSISLFITCPPKQDERGKWVEGDLRVFINPKILSVSEELWVHSEACLSIPKIHEDVVRPVSIRIEATDLQRERFQEDLHGWDARVFLHENDHINGVLFIDRVKGKQRKEIEPLLRMINKKYHPNR